MSTSINNVELSSLIYNGAEVDNWIHNGVEVWSGAKPYTVNFRTSPLSTSKSANGATLQTSVGTDTLTVSYGDGRWSGGFCNYSYSMVLPTNGCSKIQFTVTWVAGANSTNTASVNGVTVAASKTGTFTHTFDKSLKQVTVSLSGYNYIYRDATDQSAGMTITNMKFLK